MEKFTMDNEMGEALLRREAARMTERLKPAEADTLDFARMCVARGAALGMQYAEAGKPGGILDELLEPIRLTPLNLHSILKRLG